jgi:hypothetical protein
MERRQEYKTCVIEANPKELADGTGWTEEYNIELHLGSHVDVKPYFGQRVFQSKDEAIAACIEAAKRQIDRSPMLRTQ